jgi:NitT/TauT family transport system substrate-binding protein
VHVGCYELFGTDRVRVIRDLKGKTVAITGLGLTQHLFLSIMVAHVGLDPRKDVKFVEVPAAEGMQLLAEGKIDVYLGFPPDPQELRARKVGHVVVNSGADRPWSQYFCCIATGQREFVRKHPIATKRALRAILKATDICALEPDRAARALVTAVSRPTTMRSDHEGCSTTSGASTIRRTPSLLCPPPSRGGNDQVDCSACRAGYRLAFFND